MAAHIFHCIFLTDPVGTCGPDRIKVWAVEHKLPVTVLLCACDICESIQAASDSFELTTKAFDATNSDIQKITNELILSLSALQRSSASLQESFTDSDKENKAANAELIKKLISIGEDQDKSSKLMDEKANEISQSTKKVSDDLKNTEKALNEKLISIQNQISGKIDSIQASQEQSNKRITFCIVLSLLSLIATVAMHYI